MSWFKKIFGKVKILEPIVRNDFEKMKKGVGIINCDSNTKGALELVFLSTE